MDGHVHNRNVSQHDRERKLWPEQQADDADGRVNHGADADADVLGKVAYGSRKKYWRHQRSGDERTDDVWRHPIDRVQIGDSVRRHNGEHGLGSVERNRKEYHRGYRTCFDAQILDEIASISR